MLNPTMNNTNNSTINESDPWVESGAMVYVALTVATFSAIITCCTWFVVHNPEMCRWCRHRQYESVNEGENVELRTKESDEDDEEILFENDTTVQPVFTFAGSSSEGDEGDEGEGDEGDEGGKTEGPFV